MLRLEHRVLRVLLITLGAFGSTACASVGGGRAPLNYRLTEAPDSFFVVDGFRIRYREIGRGEPVILVHGRGSALDAWTWLGDSLARSYRVIAIDTRGAGQSTKSGDPARYGRAMARDVVAVLDHLHLPRAHLVGHSQGAVIVAYVAAHSPERVTSVTLLAGAFFPDSAGYAAENDSLASDLEQGRGMLRFFQRRGLNDSVAALANAEMMAQNDAPSLAAMIRAMGGLLLAPGPHPEIRARALVAVGTRDPLLPESRALADWWPGAQLIEVVGADHRSIQRHPEVLRALTAFLATPMVP